ncbi:hypothetical protein WJ0W_002666 [Paenibacillus melissococcoides]|uniref:Uncharacterized protein n=1 Tax=Paenibacillus melissococcoides TaxID=2912268 RepID=A0ABM9G2K4_9BACL|nr:hypothetical protein [Bacillus cereus]CAH8245431.1 hypothetical protein WJ0W_002666 [Paenibacillus melissococcoides]
MLSRPEPSDAKSGGLAAGRTAVRLYSPSPFGITGHIQPAQASTAMRGEGDLCLFYVQSAIK